MKTTVVPHDPQWAGLFQIEANSIRESLGPVAIAVHHIGSTAIPTICAKPIIDILVEASSLPDLDAREQTLTALGYEAMGEFGIPGRRYFRRHDANGIRTHHLHVFQHRLDTNPDSKNEQQAEIIRHLAFRDYLIAHPEIAQRYSKLKRELSARFPDDIESYMDGKHEFIQEHQRLAVEWWKARIDL